MSFLSKGIKVLGGVFGQKAAPILQQSGIPALQTAGQGLALLGSIKGVNIAKSLSRQVGCTIRQSDANQARALLAKGIDPCTGLASTPTQTITDTTLSRTFPGIIGAVTGLTKTIAPLSPETKARLGIGLPPGYSLPDASVLKQPVPPRGGGGAIPTVEFGSMSALTTYGAAGMASIGQVAALAGRTVFSAAVKRKILRVAKAIGIEAAAVALGLSITDVANVVANPPRRRRRGITGAQLANAKRVNRSVLRMADELKCACGTPRRAPVRRKTTCR